MLCEAARWRLGFNSWTPWHWRQRRDGLVICGDTTWVPLTKEQKQTNPNIVNCDKCRVSPKYLQDVENYDKLVIAVNTLKLSSKQNASELVTVACTLAEKYNTTFDTAYCILILKVLKL